MIRAVLDRPRSAVLLIAALALGLRVAAVLRSGTPVVLSGDALEYHAYAVSLSEGRYAGPNGDRAARTPGYPLFVAAVYAAAGPSPAAVLAVQAVLGTLTCLLLYWLCAVLLPSPWALVCGACAAAYFGMVEPAALATSECLYGFFLTASALVLLRPGWPAPLWRAVLGGLGLGCAVLIRPELLPVAFLALALSSISFPGFGRREALAAVMAFGLLLGLWTARNYRVFHRIVPTGTRGAANLYLGLQLPLEAMGAAERAMYRPPEGLGELERDREYLRQFREDWRRTPALSIAKAYAFNLLSVLYPFLPAFDWTFVLLAPFWVVGLWAARRLREWWLPASVVLFSIAVYMVMGGPVSRYRQGIAPFLVLLAALGMRTLWERLPRRRATVAGSVWLALNLAAWVLGPGLRQAALWLRSALW